jgi:hypothetical protein
VTDAAIAHDEAPSRLRLWTAICILFGLAAALLFLVNLVRYSNDTQHELRLIPDLAYDQRLDFNYFYGAAEMARHGDADNLYPDCRPGHYPKCSQIIYYPGNPIFRDPTIDEYSKATAIVRGSYFAPPAGAYLQAPLTYLSFKAAYWSWSLLSLGALGGFVLLAWRAGSGIVELPFLILGVVAFKPVHEVLIMGHFALFFALALTGGFLLLRGGKPDLAGLAFSVLALKPQWAVLPAIYLLVIGERRAFAVMAIASGAVFLVPFLIAGPETLPKYLRFLKDVYDYNLIEAPHMLSWNGFLFKLNAAPVDKPVYYALTLISVVPLLVVWWKGDFYLGVAATVTAMLLLSNHSVWYDWAILIVAALFLVLRAPSMSRTQRVEMWVVLLALYIAAGQSIHELLMPGRHFIDWYRTAFYSMTPVTLVALVWMASLAWRDTRTSRPHDEAGMLSA